MIEIIFTYFQKLTNQIPWSLTEWTLVLSFISISIVQFVYYLKVFKGIPRWAKQVHSGKLPLNTDPVPVSIIITACNQRASLAKNLPLILEQDYPDFQVVVVDDASSDFSSELLSELQIRYPNLYHTFVPPGVQNISARKIALTVGIKAAKYDYLLFTDANCRPSGNQWVASMMRQFTPETEIVLGYSRYENLKGILSNLMTFDNLFHAVRFLGMAASKKAYMGVGRNLAYKKELFFKQRGFASHLNLQTGEDDLFISSVANRGNTRIEVSPESVMHVNSNYPVFAWKDDRISRLQNASHYKFWPKVGLSIEVITRILCYGLFFCLIGIGLFKMDVLLLSIATVLFFVRLLIQVFVLLACSKTLAEKRFYVLAPVFDLILPFYSLIQRLEGFFTKRKSSSRQVLH